MIGKKRGLPDLSKKIRHFIFEMKINRSSGSLWSLFGLVNIILAVNYDFTISKYLVYVCCIINGIFTPFALAAFLYVLRGLYKTTKKRNRPSFLSINLLANISTSACAAILLLAKEWYFCGAVELLVTFEILLAHRIKELYAITPSKSE